MKNQILNISVISVLISILIFFTGCGLSGNKDTGTFQVLLTDAPANYESVFVDIQEVRIHKSNSADDQDSGWITVQREPMVVDLIELTNGNVEFLGEIDLEPGRYSQLRLILGDQNEVVINGESYPLTTPSAQQSGLKIQINTDIESGSAYTLLLDFDASKSVIKTGASNNYMLKPVIRASRLEQSGQIAGTIQPANALPWVYAISGSDTLRSTKAAENGDFLLIGLANKNYRVSFIPTNQNYSPMSKNDVEVRASETTNIGTVNFSN